MIRNRKNDFEDAFIITGWRAGYGGLLAALVLLLFVMLPSAQAQGESCYRWSSEVAFWMPSSGFVSGDRDLYGQYNCKGPTVGTIGFGQYGAVNVWDRDDAIEKCNEHNGHTNMVAPYGLFWSCRPTSTSTTSTTTTKTTVTQPPKGTIKNGAIKFGSSSEPDKAEAPAVQRSMSQVVVVAELEIHSGIQFQRLTAWNVGIQSVVDRGVLDVVDVWGNAAQYYEVCFPDTGKVVFLDASTSPRTMVEIRNFTKDGFSRGAMNRAGTMVLVQGSGAASPTDKAIAQSFIDSTNDPVSTAIDLQNCEVTPKHLLNLRAEPWDRVLGTAPKDTALIATARTESWFRVTVDEKEGWIAAWLSDAEGNCDWESQDDGPALAKNQLMPPDIFFGML